MCEIDSILSNFLETAETNPVDFKLVYIQNDACALDKRLTSFMVACACERAASLSAKLAARLRLRSASSLAALRRLQRSLSRSRSRSSEGMPAPCCWRRPRVASFSRIRCNQRSKGPCPGSNSAPKTFTIYRSNMHVIRKLRRAQRSNGKLSLSLLFIQIYISRRVEESEFIETNTVKT